MLFRSAPSSDIYLAHKIVFYDEILSATQRAAELDLAWIGVHGDFNLVPGLDMGEIVFGHVGFDPDILDRQKSHQRLAGGSKRTSVDLQSTHKTL